MSTDTPDLDQIINQITNNSDFKQMMENMTDEMAPAIKANQTPPLAPQAPPNSPREDDSSKQSDDEQVSTYDTLCTFFSDNEGNSVADIMQNINENLARIAASLDHLVKKGE